jgi:hypothetical protein
MSIFTAASFRDNPALERRIAKGVRSESVHRGIMIPLSLYLHDTLFSMPYLSNNTYYDTLNSSHNITIKQGTQATSTLTTRRRALSQTIRVAGEGAER